jgi:hypothetical protein
MSSEEAAERVWTGPASPGGHFVDVTEQRRLNEAREKGIPWKKWGPYLSERQWGTVREDYSQDGNAWAYFTHDQSRSRAYRWGEDGLGGISDDQQRLCFAIALWNERDPILKERIFGLTNAEGNHGEEPTPTASSHSGKVLHVILGRRKEDSELQKTFTETRGSDYQRRSIDRRIWRNCSTRVSP